MIYLINVSQFRFPETAHNFPKEFRYETANALQPQEILNIRLMNKDKTLGLSANFKVLEIVKYYILKLEDDTCVNAQTVEGIKFSLAEYQYKATVLVDEC